MGGDVASLCGGSSLLVVVVTFPAPCHRPGPPTIRRFPCTGIVHHRPAPPRLPMRALCMRRYDRPPRPVSPWSAVWPLISRRSKRPGPAALPCATGRPFINPPRTCGPLPEGAPMFTGIVEEIGTLEALTRLPGGEARLLLRGPLAASDARLRSEEHTSELQSRGHLV